MWFSEKKYKKNSKKKNVNSKTIMDFLALTKCILEFPGLLQEIIEWHS